MRVEVAVAGSGRSAAAHEPFEELWRPFSAAFRRELASRAAVDWTFLTRGAIDDLERGLLRELSRIGLATAFPRFRSFRSSRLGAFAAFASPESDETYRAYVDFELARGMAGLYRRHSSLEGLLTNRADRWLAAHSELCDRFAADLPALRKRWLGHGGSTNIAAVATGLSDFHAGGRTTAILTLASGLNVVYKPRPVAIDVAFHELLLFLNRHGAPVDFRVFDVLDRGSFGWTQHIEHGPCAEDAAAARYHERVGALLAVLYVLHATDCHLGNVIASVGHLVLVDIECVLSPGMLLVADATSDRGGDAGGGGHSVTSIGILPAPAGVETGVDHSALGAYQSQRTGRLHTEVAHAATDAMTLVSVPETVVPEANVLLGEKGPIHPHRYVNEIVHGFSDTYRLLMRLRDADSAEGLLMRFRGHQVRLLVRDTRVYSEILDIANEPGRDDGEWLARGLRRLAQPFLTGAAMPESTPILQAEAHALMRGDVPVFRVRTDSTVIEADDGTRIGGLLRRTPYECALERVGALSEHDLQRQVELIRWSLG